MSVLEVNVPHGPPLRIDAHLLDPFRNELADLGPAEPVRLAYAAAHVVLRPEYSESPHASDAPADSREVLEAIDWDATAELRRRIAACGFGIAEAMDTAQRFAIGWPAAERLIRMCGELKLPQGFVGGAWVDHLDAIPDRAALIDGVCEQVRVIQQAGGIAIILPLRWLPQWKCDEDEYVEAYRAIIENSDGPLLVHWLGEMFAPDLRGYFPGDSFQRVMDLDPARVRGAKLSLLDEPLEVDIRRRLLANEQIILTGDDFNFAPLIAGSDSTTDLRFTRIGDRRVALGDFSHALLGILDAIAEPAGLALQLLAHGRRERYDELMRPCQELSRIIFEAPTQHYKTGLAFLRWINGDQSNRMLINHEHNARSHEHLLRAARAAIPCGVFTDAGTAATRLTQWLEYVRA